MTDQENESSVILDAIKAVTKKLEMNISESNKNSLSREEMMTLRDKRIRYLEDALELLKEISG